MSEYAEQDKQDSIFSEFERIIKKVPNDNLVWRVFLGSMASENNRINDKIDSVKVKSMHIKQKNYLHMALQLLMMKYIY